MNTKTKKGFTLTELIIVVVIIGILAAVLIPTLTACVKKAKISNDKQLVRNLNLALASDETTIERGGKHLHMQEALDAAFKAGYDVTKINATKADNEILWDSANDVFCYYNDGEIEYIPSSATRELSADLESDCILLWQILKVENSGDKGYADLTEKQFSVYAKEESTAAIVKTNKGFDAGKYSGLTSVEYTRNTPAGSVVVLRTNSASTSLTINGYVDSNNPTIGDTVKHYEAVGSLVINSVASASYHEFGQVAFAEIATGRIVLESESGVEHIHLTATEGNFNDITVAKASDVEMPKFSRDPVEIPAEGKLVVALQDGTEKDDNKDYVWLTAVGVYEQVTVSSSSTVAGNNYAANSDNQEKKDTAQQIANNISVEVGGDTYTVKAEKTSSGWDYVLVDEDKQVSEEYSVSGTPVVTVTTQTVEQTTTTTTTVTVSVVDTNEAAVSSTPTIENGLTEAAKEEKQTELVNEAIIPELADQYEEETAAVVYNLSTKVYYEDLYTAIAEVPENTKTTLVLLKNISGTSNANYQIPANKIIVLDLNGKVLNTVAPDESAAYTIENKGILVIKDATDKAKNGSGTGKITSSAVKPDMQDVPGYASNTITNLGNLTIESGIIENRGAGYACFAIDNQTNGNLYTPVLTVNGGKMLQESQYHYAVRMFCNSTTKANTCVINGGIIEGGYAFWLQTPNNNANMASLTINGGTFIAHDGYAVYFGGSGSSADGRNYSNTSIVFNGGTLNRVMVGAIPSNTNAPIKFEINGGTITELVLGNNVVPTIKEGWSVTE